METLEKRIKELDEIGKFEVYKHFDWLIMQILFSSGLVEPYYFFIDNCIIQDVKNQKINTLRYYRFLSTCLFFKFITEKSGIDAKIAIPASILYEFSGKKEFKDENDYLFTVNSLLQCLKPFDLDVVTLGFSDYKDAKKSIDAIKFDEIKIRKLIKNIKNKEWNIALKENNITHIPMAIAYKALPKNIKLRYFNEGYVRWVLASIIETMILNNRNNDKKVRKDFRHDLTFSLAALNKVSTHTIEGLGDLELLSYCDVTAQFQNNKPFTCLAITFDENLFKSFLNRQTLVSTHEPFVIGVDSETDRDRKLKQMDEGIKRLDITSQKESEFRDKISLFYFQIKEIFI